MEACLAPSNSIARNVSQESTGDTREMSAKGPDTALFVSWAGIRK